MHASLGDILRRPVTLLPTLPWVLWCIKLRAGSTTLLTRRNNLIDISSGVNTAPAREGTWARAGLGQENELGNKLGKHIRAVQMTQEQSGPRDSFGGLGPYNPQGGAGTLTLQP